jgi:hypothetical protein
MLWAAVTLAAIVLVETVVIFRSDGVSEAAATYHDGYAHGFEAGKAEGLEEGRRELVPVPVKPRGGGPVLSAAVELDEPSDREIYVPAAGRPWLPWHER